MLRTGSTRESNEGLRKSSIRKNDEVIVLSGKDRGKKGRVLRVSPSKGTAVVERVNLVKKHTRKNPQKNQSGGILEKEAPIQLSKLMVVCPNCSKPSRLGSKQTGEGRSRVCKHCGTELQ
jgi:large subunit ribosomal protein L24